MFRITALFSIFMVCLFILPKLAMAETVIRTHKDWQVRLITDDFTDETSVILNTIIEDIEEDFSRKRGIVLIGSQFSNKKTEDMLVIKCDKANTKPYVVILTNKRVNGDGTRNIEYRVDKRPSQKTLMKTNENYLMVFNHRKASQFISNIRSGKMLIGRSSDRESGLIKFKIPIEGFNDIESELYRYCKPH